MRLVNWFIADRLDMLVRPNYRKHELLKWGIFFLLLAILGFLYIASSNT